MTTQGQLQTAAHHHRVKGRHHRFAGVIQRIDEVDQMRFLNRFG